MVDAKVLRYKVRHTIAKRLAKPDGDSPAYLLDFLQFPEGRRAELAALAQRAADDPDAEETLLHWVTTGDPVDDN